MEPRDYTTILMASWYVNRKDPGYKIETSKIYYGDYSVDEYERLPAPCKCEKIKREFEEYHKFKNKWNELQIGRWHK